MNPYIKQEISRTVEVMQAILADQALLDTVEQLGAACVKAIAAGGKVMFCGNGGSADCQLALWTGPTQKVRNAWVVPRCLREAIPNN